MASSPALTGYRTAHLHMLLLGFVTMMIAGVAYHIIPRFAATPLYSEKLAYLHLVAANLGLLLLAGGFMLRVHAIKSAPGLLATGGVISALGAYLLAFNIWRTIDHAAPPPKRRPPAPRPKPTSVPPGS